jgi:NADPH2:quinone reductase
VRAALCSELGPPDVVRVTDVDEPVLGAGQARVAVQVASVNFPDVLLVAGEYQIPVVPPFVPGSELAGVVTEVADDVTSVRRGDRVFGSTLVGAFAEQAVVGATALTPVPDGVDLAAAAGFGVAHRTAYHVLRSTAGLQSGEELVVLGAGGGVGLAAVQLGALMGATVTAVASTREKLDTAAELGATRLVDHRQGDLRRVLKDTVPTGTDVVVDPVGGELSEPALRSMRWGGRFVTVGYASGVVPRIPLNLVLLKGVHVLGFQFLDFATHAPDDMARNEAELMALFAAGRAFPHIGARFALGDAAAALHYVKDGRAIGKVVLDIASGE